MPANSKYLTTPSQRAVKITTGIVGGYLVSATFHLLLASFPVTRDTFIILSSFSFFIVWAGLLLLPFLARNGWNAALLYLLMALVFGGTFWYLKSLFE